MQPRGGGVGERKVMCQLCPERGSCAPGLKGPAKGPGRVLRMTHDVSGSGLALEAQPHAVLLRVPVKGQEQLPVLAGCSGGPASTQGPHWLS